MLRARRLLLIGALHGCVLLLAVTARPSHARIRATGSTAVDPAVVEAAHHLGEEDGAEILAETACRAGLVGNLRCPDTARPPEKAATG